MLAATKESRMIPRDPDPQGVSYLSIYIHHHSIFSPPDENCSKKSEKAPEGIDKTQIEFIIGLWGKVGKRVDRCIINDVGETRPGRLW